jgi:hypothetical protein
VPSMRFLRLLIVLLILIALASQAARFLVVDHPEKSDAIVVLAGKPMFARPSLLNCCTRESRRECFWMLRLET